MESQFIPGTQLLEGVPLNSWKDALIGALYYEKKRDLVDILLAANPKLHYGVEIDWAADILEPNATLGHLVITKPEQILPVLDDALLDIQRSILETHERAIEMTLKPNIHARLHGFGSNLETVHRNTMPRANDVGKFLSLSATVIRTGLVKMLEVSKKYMCCKCQNTFYSQADRKQYNMVPKPVKCLANMSGSARESWNCSGNKFVPVVEEGLDKVLYRDYQEITVQERADKLSLRSMPRSMVVLLENDLVDNCQAGDDITLTGVVLQRWRALYPGSRCDVDLAILANHINVKNEEKASVVVTDAHRRAVGKFWREHQACPLRGRNRIIASICPQMYGCYLVKLAVALILAGGVPQRGQTGVKIRGESHLLLVGDPGTGKSQFLQFAAKVVPRSVLTTGFGSTNAGLTVAAVRDSGEWMLEAGALVLADRGLCCIDEFSSIRGNDKTAIHEAMEQQSLSVAKAGLVCKLNTQCSIIAATNVKGRFDPAQPLSVNLALGSPLLSRFDLVLILLDTQDEEWDARVSSFILESEAQRPAGAAVTVGADDWDLCDEKAPWTLKQLRAYFALVKSELAPELSSDAKKVLSTYYTLQRQADSLNAARTTIRLLESLVRLSQAHARITFQQTVTVRDAVTAVMLMDASMQAANSYGSNSSSPRVMQSKFADDPDAEYLEVESKVLRSLGLSHLATLPKATSEPLSTFALPNNLRERDRCPPIFRGEVGSIPSQPSSVSFSAQVSSDFNKDILLTQTLSDAAKPQPSTDLDRLDLLVENTPLGSLATSVGGLDSSQKKTCSYLDLNEKELETLEVDSFDFV